MAYDFDKIACTYDRLNHLMTLGLDHLWRRRAVREVERGNRKVECVLDVACGTGDMVLELTKRSYLVTGVDLSEEMLAIAKRKVENGKWEVADAEHLPYDDNSFDAVTCAFGVRNFVHLEKGLNEMLRVLKPGGRIAILELSTPDSPLVRPFYNLYTRHIIPWLGQRIAGSREAYTYLPQSIERFPKGDDFLRILNNSNDEVFLGHQKLTFGVCRLYTVQKTEKQRGYCVSNPHAY